MSKASGIDAPPLYDVPVEEALLLYAQPAPTCAALVVGDRGSLGLLRDAIDHALQSTEGAASFAISERGMKGHHGVRVAIADGAELSRLSPPFTADTFQSNQGMAPELVYSLRALCDPTSVGLEPQ